MDGALDLNIGSVRLGFWTAQAMIKIAGFKFVHTTISRLQTHSLQGADALVSRFNSIKIMGHPGDDPTSVIAQAVACTNESGYHRNK